MNLKEVFGTGFEQRRLEVWIIHPYPPEADRSIVRGKPIFVLTEPGTRNYASECNELYWFQKKFSTIWTRLDSSEVKQKSQIIQGG